MQRGRKMAPTRQTHLTPEGREALSQELEHLTGVRRREVAARINKANETGGTVDNAEYEEAKNEQAFVEGRIADIESILSRAVVTRRSRGRKKAAMVEFGSSVAVTNSRGAKVLYQVVGGAEANPSQGKISESSPVGQALMGRKVGDVVDVETPAGVQKLTINKVT